MTFARSLVFFVCFQALTLALAIISLILFWAPTMWILKIARVWSFTTLVLLDKICGLKYRIRGQANVPTHPYIMASKHQSAWETVAYQYLFGPTNFMFKKELIFIPFFGYVLWKSGNVMVNRGSTTKSGLAKMMEKIKDILRTRNLVIFPEGTRKSPGANPDYKSGLATIAKAIPGSFVLPVAVNSGRFWKKGGFMKYPGTIEVVIGKPLNTDDFDSRQALTTKVEAAIEENMKSI
ncbi:MAG: 1-acyl-sn-glycerol-3-phosphate acyltransferase [Alphaproteobacteria bacterium]|nr:1-acyl-sn-glycerol-3-phosphate acyltransferase [Alphaproteobacteria bacterium]